MSNSKILKILSEKPRLYHAGTTKFWDDEHISKGMLEAHLNPLLDSATRNIAFVKKSVRWIAEISDIQKRPRLLDLGCGPGIYAELLTAEGFQVTGIDYSRRSIEYARKSAMEKQMAIDYRNENYLNIDFRNEFDVVVMIYCDFGVLDPDQQKGLLCKIHKALKPGGLFIFDAFTPKEYENRDELSNWSYCDGGYWSENPYACLYCFYRYDFCNTFAEQYLIIEENDLRCFNLWNHAFTPDEVKRDLIEAGFQKISLLGDIAGSSLAEDSPTICAAAQK